MTEIMKCMSYGKSMFMLISNTISIFCGCTIHRWIDGCLTLSADRRLSSGLFCNRDVIGGRIFSQKPIFCFGFEKKPLRVESALASVAAHLEEQCDMNGRNSETWKMFLIIHVGMNDHFFSMGSLTVKTWKGNCR